MLSRRTILAAPALVLGFHAGAAPAADMADALAALERKTGGQLGVAILDAGTGAVQGHRLDERFPLCSTHKLLSAAFVLARVDAGQEQLGRRITFGPDVLLFHSPITKAHVGGAGMTLAELCAAAVTVSDNAAANLLLQSFGGPEALTAHLRRHGDTVTRLDRTEPTLNESLPGDPRDTTTPRAMAALVRDFALGAALSEGSRAQLQGWMVDCQTGLTKIRAGVPSSWRIGDKTGSGGAPRHANNDVAVLWRPDCAPLVVTAYTIDVPGDEAKRDAALAEIGRIAAAL